MATDPAIHTLARQITAEGRHIPGHSLGGAVDEDAGNIRGITRTLEIAREVVLGFVTALKTPSVAPEWGATLLDAQRKALKEKLDALVAKRAEDNALAPHIGRKTTGPTAEDAAYAMVARWLT